VCNQLYRVGFGESLAMMIALAAKDCAKMMRMRLFMI
jgi:hypothetical protein